MRKAAFALALTLFSVNLYAAVKSWQIVPEESHLGFVAIQNDAPVKGQFKALSGDIQFDKDNLPQSHIQINVDIGSVSTSYQPIADTLKTTEWLNAKVFPKAQFVSKSIKKIADNQYQTAGTLTIRDKTAPVVIDFSLVEDAPQKMHAKGKTSLKRTQFGVGQGEWKSTAEIKDEVKIEFNLALVSH